MTQPRDAGLVGEAIATLDEARLHSYDPTAAFSAAVAHLEGATAMEAATVAAVIAAWVVTHLNPTVELTDLASWLETVSAIAKRERS